MIKDKIQLIKRLIKYAFTMHSSAPTKETKKLIELFGYSVMIVLILSVLSRISPDFNNNGTAIFFGILLFIAILFFDVKKAKEITQKYKSLNTQQTETLSFAP